MSGWGIGSLVPAVCQLECRITVYLPQEDGDLRRAVFVENGRRCYREADGSGDRGEAGLKLAKVTERLQAGAEPGTAGHGRAIGARTHVAVPAGGCMAF